MRVHIRHLRALKYCMKGARKWAQRYGFDWGQLLREGWDCADLRRTNNDLALKAVELAEQEAEQ